ncbi:type II toxin-antitoxin system PemK/MazF family toxin [Dolichospermum circinale CS-1225]|uniref:mRNA interferase n=1 Tax=Dolichospermum circinale CS-537/01 TaxID=3021739 RepID=A0ABT5A7W7_9CYAN|nr:type II toxin-antitoxin system PemK/MazF family toxin [Dolichospermum circinale]MDB9466457.1 type II toxin-antitoxin system PemK/MazF family toxin [Dolichospermum circinale CS-539/09]MDB9470421.1 type II toxin-antitoxin system PemK/MazF family toxin [Dolichospermum circinale CS-539]MDB9488045.1 type II toxin-antitoxin system PemK/MazF family toxin [Dolichospermum circinale CS-537/01]MDB9522947.1 type II toxin-antitoxin system PemK/MazF family toxin [Dolichospermum circinale CS-1225]
MPEGNLTYKRGEIRWVNLDPTVGAEAQKIRACLIVQSDIMNQYGLLTIVMPFRPGSKQAPYIVNIKATVTNGLDKDSFIDVAQIRSVDYRRVLGLVGILEVEYWEEIRRYPNKYNKNENLDRLA